MSAISIMDSGYVQNALTEGENLGAALQALPIQIAEAEYQARVSRTRVEELDGQIEYAKIQSLEGKLINGPNEEVRRVQRMLAWASYEPLKELAEERAETFRVQSSYEIDAERLARLFRATLAAHKFIMLKLELMSGSSQDGD